MGLQTHSQNESLEEMAKATENVVEDNATTDAPVEKTETDVEASTDTVTE